MRKYLTIWLLFLCLGSLSIKVQSQEDEDPILVRLTTESPLKPIYLVPLVSEQTSFDPHYLRQLEQVLFFDFSHNGTTSIVKRNDYHDSLAASGPFEEMGPPSEWKYQNILYVIKPRVQNNTLSALVLDVHSQTLKSIETIPLSGQLSQDRRQIHKLSDSIHKALFGIDGIASTRILYTVKVPVGPNKWIANVWEADYDGANARQITRENALCVTPIYIPPKPGFLTGGFMYVSYQLGQPKILVSSLKDGTGQRLTYLPGTQLMPAVSWQRDKVAFISDVTGNPDLFVQPFSPETGAQGKPQQVFSAKQATQGSPCFSPDGKKLAFVSNKDGSPRIYVISIPQPGASLKNIKANLITKRNRENSAPSWSPDGKKIAYCARSQGERQIWVYDFTTNEERQLTEGAGNKENPSWAPDSLHLVFNSSDTNHSELFLINLNQAESIQITGGPGEKRFPNWEPRSIQ